MSCPVCGEADVQARLPRASPQPPPTDYRKVCLVGTAHGEHGGVRFYHDA